MPEADGALPRRRVRASLFLGGLAIVGALLGGCSGGQSALDPAGDEADKVAHLFWLMLIGSGVIWAVVIGIALYAARFKRAPHSERTAGRFVVVGGIVVPTIVLTGLLVYGLTLMTEVRAPAEGDLTIAVSGEQFWFRVRYERPDREAVESANDVRVPVGRRVAFALTSPDVIHSFWIPSLAGKMDMIPGRTNRMVVQATRPGTYRGVCAEFCGTSHARMAFTVTAMEPDDYAAWLEREGMPSAGSDPAAFLRNGCGACHAVRGTPAQGRLGPDLTHLASRATIGAGTLPNTPETVRRFVTHTDAVKPGSKMPAFGMLPPQEIDAIVAYLGSLR